MQITHLSLTNFRNYGRLELTLPVGATLLHGDNAQGKTNLLEAIYYLATTRSSQVDQDHHLISWEAIQIDDPMVVGRIVAQIRTNNGGHQLEMRLIREKNANFRDRPFSFRREALVDKRKVRLMDLLGHLRVVLFLPEDIQLITGSPSSRRRYLDVTLCQIDPIYCRTLSNYNKVLEQRNALLRQLAENNGNRQLLPIYSEKLVALGSQIFARRAAFLDELAREAKRIHYEELTDGRETIRLHYQPRLINRRAHQAKETAVTAKPGEWLQESYDNVAAIQEAYQGELASAQTIDLARGTTTIGPHRDDWEFQINGRPLSSFGSRGQQRSAILALKMAEINWMANKTGETPILLLDEVVAELDEKRRASLLSYTTQAAQAILTATDTGMFTQSFIRQATLMMVQNGRIQVEHTTG